LSSTLHEVAARLTAATTAASAARALRDALAPDGELDDRGRDLAKRRQDLGGVRAELEADVRASIAELEKIAADRAAHAALSEEHATLAGKVRTAQEAHLEARAAYLSAREARLDAMAAELAAGLEPGEACPVCGAVDHPHPAGGGSGHDLRAAESAAELVATERQASLAAAQGALDTCAGRLASYDLAQLEALATATTERAASRREALTQLAAEDAAFVAEGEALDAEVAAKRAAVAAVQAAEETVGRVEREHAATREALATATAQVGDGPVPSPADLDTIEAQLRRIDAEVAGAVDARDRIRALEAEVDRQRARSVQARASVAEHQQAARGLRSQAAGLQAELISFRGQHETVAAAATAALHHARALEAAVQVLADYRTGVRERDFVANQLREIAERDAAAAILTDEDPSDVHERVTFRARRRAESAELATDAAAELREATRCQVAVAEADASLKRALAALGPAAEAAERVIRLDATVRGTGDNLRKISLATYVLAARLEEVAAAATGHLLRMSSGRYELLHHDDRYGGGPAGLGLRVRDGWTGEERDTATLSGGEAFYASLALALGLAEVVTNEAGGRPLDTLLVDEGFGSLDADTLEEVLGELDQLRAAGRSIGLVSHVPALAERIPAQLRVTPGRAGSMAKVVVGATV
ncbi:MAG: SbcC/MukB-like Walker B domain-containing protein, partial [Solirubrobacteraceae bacterium]|nr:SbcC/MukB-like Walker B domain-containing protein [Solirubrobacteraceae bacterium]